MKTLYLHNQNLLLLRYLPLFNYSRKLAASEILVTTYYDHCEIHYLNLDEDMAQIAQQFGFTFIPNNQKSCDINSFFIKHLIYLTDNTDIYQLLMREQKKFSNYSSISIGILYNKVENMLANKALIDEIKQSYQHVNFLRCDTFLSDGKCIISREKILDNAVCDTVRIKYTPVLIDRPIEQLIKPYQDFFMGIASLYKKYKLYHRSPKDGFISIRCPEGILITATHTYKDPLDLDRISLVYGYQEEKNEITYSGYYLPSSDVVEACVVYQHVPDIQAIVHTHASDLFTRNPRHTDKIAVPKSSYGLPQLGYQIVNKVSSYFNQFLIMEEHGEIFPFCFHDNHRSILTHMEETILKCN